MAKGVDLYPASPQGQGHRIRPPKGPHPPRWGTFSTKAWRRDDMLGFVPSPRLRGEGGSGEARDG